MSVLELNGLSLSLPVGEAMVAILADISFRFESGRIYAITGPNGSGKSSLAKCVMGLYMSTGGTICLDGQDITRLSVTERAGLGIGYAFQNPPRFKGIRVRDLLAMACSGPAGAAVADHRPSDGIGASGEPDADAGLARLLTQVGLCAEDYIDRDLDTTLSGGEIKRLEIATVLARRPRVAIFDEPEAGIDLWGFHHLAETFQRLHAESDTTLIIISHQERILSLADAVILMAAGRISQVMDAADVACGRLERCCLCGSDCVKGVGHDAGPSGPDDA